MRPLTVITCECCRLRQQVRGSIGDERRVDMCAMCFEHRGADNGMTQRRRTEHDAMLRERLVRAEQLTQSAYSERDRARQRMLAAFQSRDSAFSILKTVNDLHEFRRDGSCSCGVKRDCKTAAVVYRGWVQAMIRRLDDAEAEQRDE